MRIVRIALDAQTDQPALECETVEPGLNVFFDPSKSARTAAADLIGHALYGKRLTDGSANNAIDGELIVDSGRRGFRLRRHVDGGRQTRLTVAALDGAPVDRSTVRGFLAGLSPDLARPIYAAQFAQPLPGDELLSEEFLRKAAGVAGEKQASVDGPRMKLPDRLRTLAGEVHHNGHAVLERPPAQLIDDARRQLSAVQQQLELAAYLLSKNGNAPRDADHHGCGAAEHPLREASTRLAELTGGRLVGVELSGQDDGVRVESRDGQLLPPEWLTPAGCSQVRLSLCLAMLSACKRQGVQLPLVLDEPFAHLETADVAVMAQMLEDTARHGQQMFVFTGQEAAAERFAALGVAVRQLRTADSSPAAPEACRTASDLAAA